MKIIRLFKARRKSEIDYNYFNYNHNSFFTVLWYRLFKISPCYPALPEQQLKNIAPPGYVWLMSEHDLLTAPLSYLISVLFLSNNGYDWVIGYIKKHDF